VETDKAVEFFKKIPSQYVAEVGPKLLGSSNPPASTLLSSWNFRCVPPLLALPLLKILCGIKCQKLWKNINLALKTTWKIP
jgi:hypothetical protein